MQPCSVYSYVVYSLCLCMYTCSDFSGQRLFTGLDYWTGLLNWTRSQSDEYAQSMSQLPYMCSPTICPLVKRTMSRQICGTGTFSSWPITQTLSQRRSGRSLKMPSWPLTCSWGGRSLTIKKKCLQRKQYPCKFMDLC